ncbi:15211_t:CDS:2, partial [Funneliformis geosporum]
KLFFFDYYCPPGGKVPVIPKGLSACPIPPNGLVDEGILSFRTIDKASRKYGFACPMFNLRRSAFTSYSL